MHDISGSGLRLQIIASSTFPTGFSVTQFADDVDPFSVNDLDVSKTAIGLNGDLISYSMAAPIEMTINVIPGSDDEKNLAFIADVNRVGKGKVSVRDVIHAVVLYPDGSTTIYRNGTLTKAPSGKSVVSAGRLKSSAYIFTFESYNKA